MAKSPALFDELYFRVIPCKVKANKYLWHLFERKEGKVRATRVNQGQVSFNSILEAQQAGAEALEEYKRRNGTIGSLHAELIEATFGIELGNSISDARNWGVDSHCGKECVAIMRDFVPAMQRVLDITDNDFNGIEKLHEVLIEQMNVVCHG